MKKIVPTSRNPYDPFRNIDPEPGSLWLYQDHDGTYHLVEDFSAEDGRLLTSGAKLIGRQRADGSYRKICYSITDAQFRLLMAALKAR